jgi:hypothetical protein
VIFACFSKSFYIFANEETSSLKSNFSNLLIIIIMENTKKKLSLRKEQIASFEDQRSVKGGTGTYDPISTQPVGCEASKVLCFETQRPADCIKPISNGCETQAPEGWICVPNTAICERPETVICGFTELDCYYYTDKC